MNSNMINEVKSDRENETMNKKCENENQTPLLPKKFKESCERCSMER